MIRLVTGIVFILLFGCLTVYAIFFSKPAPAKFTPVSGVIQADTSRTDTIALPLKPTIANYSQVQDGVVRKRLFFQRQLSQATTLAAQHLILDSAGSYLARVLVDELIPHWYGTPWTFEGYTEVPGHGSVACGYFVSTLLNHAGLNLNRYKMAQQNPVCEVMTLHQQPQYITFKALTRTSLSDSVKQHLKEGLYIFGKTFHVGFMLLRAGKVYLIHSNYTWEIRKVMPELLKYSSILEEPPYLIFGEITSNRGLVRQWIENIPVTVLLPENMH